MRFDLKIGPTFKDLCDASAVAPLGGNQFIAASDEPTLGGRNQLCIYEFPAPEPIAKLDLSKFLRGQETPNDPRALENDLESAARIDDTIFWISSHGRDASGHHWPDRQRFFAIAIQNGVWRPLGIPYANLLNDLEELVPLIKTVEKKKWAPEEGGVSIEGLCRGHGKQLLIGFRSPLLDGEALIVPLLNPHDVANGKKARLGIPLTLDLDRRGVRDCLKLRDDYWLILAGTSTSKGTFALFHWEGDPKSQPVALGEVDEKAGALGLDRFHPEAILQLDDKTLWLISDDGNLKDNKHLPNARRTFRTAQLILHP